MSQQYNNGTTTPLRQLHRYITTHDAYGKAAFATEHSEKITQLFPSTRLEAALHVHYHTSGFPITFKDDADLKAFSKDTQNIPLSKQNGSVLRIVDIGPGQQSPMHRTSSLDYGVVLDGEIELYLENWEGPMRLMKVGDVSIQRGTLHGWRNASKENWGRMMYVLLPSEELVFDGKKLEEDYNGIELPH